jgi:hypothetical protein
VGGIAHDRQTASSRPGPPDAPTIAGWLVLAAAITLPLLGWSVGREYREPTTATLMAISQASFLLSGWIVMRSAPGNRIGPLLVLIGLLDLSSLGVYSDSAAVDTISWVLLGAGDVFLVILVLIYPSGRFEDRLDRIVASTIVGLIVITWVLELLAAEPAAISCETCLANPFRVLDPQIRIWWGRNVLALAFPIGGVVAIALVARRWLRSTRPARVRLAPLLVAGIAKGAAVTLALALPGSPPNAKLALAVTQAFVPLALAVGLARTWRRRLLATERVAGLADDAAPSRMSPTVAAALGDPGASILLWSPAIGGYVDDAGRPTILPANPMALTVVSEGSERLAAIIHDPSLADDRSLLAAVAGAVRLAILRARLQASINDDATVLEHSPGLRQGAFLGGFRIVRPLGRGGMGIVYLAEDPVLRRPVALKVLAPAIATDPGFRERFEREASLAASLDHPNIVPVLTSGEDAGRLYLAMQYVDGPDLAQHLAAGGPLAADEAVAVIEQVAAALDAAHGLGMVHRDVKAANILLDPRDSRVYLADFGLARPTAAGATLTRPGGFVGSLDTMAPERIRGEAAGPASDIYALGCLLFECLAGHPPFDRGGDLATLWAHLQAPVPRVAEGGSGSPTALNAVIARAMAKEPADRYASAGDLSIAARATLSPPTVLPPATM